jgi:hypothetical protein
MSEIELKKKQLELKRVAIAREDMELQIMMREEDIARLKTNIELQLKREKELLAELNK